ncbi:hypothetical protein MJL81_34050, partial [Salmonella enterica subsp. enterica serovar Anatum]|nr:hypothetical protein [Salmonella enterica subsp. enterica serovar Anatum]
DTKYIPQRLCRTNASGTPVNGYLLTLVLVAILIMLPTLGIGDSRNYAQANLEAGLNFAEWTLRSRYMLTNNDGEYRTDSLYT